MRTIKIHLIIFVLCFFSSFPVFAQDPPPPPEDGHGSEANGSPGGGAPIDGSPFILPLLAVGYGAIKWYRNHNKYAVGKSG